MACSLILGNGEFAPVPPRHLEWMSLNGFQILARAKTLAPALTWGTFGPNQNEQVQRKLLIELETDHLENILITQVHIPPVYRAIILEILKDRYIFGL